MEKDILNEILKCVKNLSIELNLKLHETEERLRKEFKKELQEIKVELRESIIQEVKEMIEKSKQETIKEVIEEVKVMIEESKKETIKEVIEQVKVMIEVSKQETIKQISSEVGEQFNNVMIVINKVENERHDKITEHIIEHERKAVKGVDALRKALVS